MRILLLCVLICSMVASGLSAVYYVDNNNPAASDSNDGFFETPWLTVQHGLEQVTAGDTLYIREGIYNEYLTISQSGSPEAPITLCGYPDEEVILDGNGLEWRYGIDVGGSDYWTIQNLKVRDYIREGLRGNGFVSWGGSEGITLRSLEFSLVGTPVKFHEGGKHILIEDIDAFNYTSGAFDCGPAGPCDGLTIRRFRASGPGEGNDTAVDGFAVEEGKNVLIEDCISENHPGDGFDFKSDSTILRRVIARNNTRNNIKLWGVGSRLENSLSHDCGLTNLVLAEGGSYQIINCTIANRTSYGYLMTAGFDEALETPIQITNTIFYNSHPEMGGTLVYFGGGVILNADHNMYYNPFRETDVICAEFMNQCYNKEDITGDTWFNTSGCGEHSQYADPVFVNSSTCDFHLQPTSPAVDTGQFIAELTDDLEGLPRFSGPAIDIGAYEYQGNTGFPSRCGGFFPEDGIVLQNYPNPFNNSTQIQYSVPFSGSVQLSVMNMSGQDLQVLYKGECKAGIYTAFWQGKNARGVPVSSGFYLVCLKINGFIKVAKLLLLK